MRALPERFCFYSRLRLASRRTPPPPRQSWLALAAAILVVTSSISITAAEPPRIDRIEFFLSDQVTVHFDTESGRRYELQFRDPGGPASAPWTNLFVAPNLPFPNHYIVVDTRTNQARVYRLRITP
jgi:hypothetical protein